MTSSFAVKWKSSMSPISEARKSPPPNENTDVNVSPYGKGVTMSGGNPFTSQGNKHKVYPKIITALCALFPRFILRSPHVFNVTDRNTKEALSFAYRKNACGLQWFLSPIVFLSVGRTLNDVLHRSRRTSCKSENRCGLLGVTPDLKQV